MGKYQAGETTKKKILQISKLIFYKKGYEDALYNDIAKEADVNRALIPYHFKRKSDLALEVYNDFMRDYVEIRDSIAEGYSSEVRLVIGILLFYRLIEDENVLRFVDCIIKEEPFQERLFLGECIMYEKHLKDVKQFSKKKWNLIMHMVCGMDNENVHMIYHREYKDIREVGETMIHMFFEYLGYSAVKVGQVFHKANRVLDQYTYQVSEYFEISYQEKVDVGAG